MLTCSGCDAALDLDTWLQHAVLLRHGHPCVPRIKPCVGLIASVDWVVARLTCEADGVCSCCRNSSCACADSPPGDRCACGACRYVLATSERISA